jgi:ADP-ribosyl-[dinitrogen reductase] hydrolase
MLGSIAGDIIGSRFERRAGPPRDFALFHPACRFTDDTVCGLAVADALLGRRDFAASLRDFVRRHPRRGYGGMFLDWALSDDAPAYGSWGNGAPMRVAAVGWLARDEAEARDLAAAQAAVSHDHPDAIAAAQAVALAIFMARCGMSRADLRQRLIDRFGYDLTPERALSADGFDFRRLAPSRQRLPPRCRQTTGKRQCAPPSVWVAIRIPGPASPARWPRRSMACRGRSPQPPGAISRQICARS